MAIHPPRWTSVSPAGLATEVRSGRGVTTVHLAGELDGTSAGPMETELRRAEALGTPRLVLDVCGITFLDSNGMRALVDAHERCARRGMRLTVVARRGPVRRLLEISGVIDLLDVREGPGEAP